MNPNEDVENAVKALSYIIDVIIAWMDEAEKNKDWRAFSEYATLLQNTRKLMTGDKNK